MLAIYEYNVKQGRNTQRSIKESAFGFYSGGDFAPGKATPDGIRSDSEK